MMLRRAPLLCLWGSTVLALLRAPTVPARHRLSTPLCVDGATLALDDEGAYAEDETKFVAWLEAELADAPGRTDYPEIFVDASAAVLQWRRRFRGDRKLWQRLMKDRVLKEIVELAPVLAMARDFVESCELADGERITILDLCSGKGFCSMLLSEMLPADRVERCVLVDKAWPMNLPGRVLGPHHMNPEHLYGVRAGLDGGAAGTYFEDWPIPLVTSKQNLKSKADLRTMQKRILDRASGPVLVLAVHLCGTLSLRALDLFNAHPKCKALVLKPCCLPAMVHANRDEVFQVGRHTFNSSEVCASGRFNGRAWKGPPRHDLQPRFDRWAGHLLKGVDLGDGGTKALETSPVQVKGGYQNLFVFAERGEPTRPLWSGIAERRQRIAGRMPSLDGSAQEHAFI